MSKKADKTHTKRQMSVVLERVSALLNDESDKPSFSTKRCLSCDRIFNKASFQELAEQVHTNNNNSNLFECLAAARHRV